MKTFLRNYRVSIPAAIGLVFVLTWVAFGYFGVHKLWVDDTVNEAAPVFDNAPLTASTEAPSTTPPTSTLETLPVTVAVTATTVPPVATTIAPSATVPALNAQAPAPVATAPPPVATAPAPATTAPAPVTTVPPPIATAAPQPVVEASGSFVSRNHPTRGNALVLGQGGQRFLRLEQFATDNGPDLKVYLVNSSAGGVTDHVSLGALKGNIGDQNYELPVGLDLQLYDTVLIYCERFASPFGEAVLSLR